MFFKRRCASVRLCSHSSRRPRAAGLLLGSALGLAIVLFTPALGAAQVKAPGPVAPAGPEAQRPRIEIPIHLDRVDTMHVTSLGRILPPATPGGGGTRTCNAVSTWTNASFSGGTYTLQAGIADGEMLAQSYTIAASEFPVHINLVETLFGTQNASVQTVTQWSMLFYSGTPTSGTLVQTYVSDDVVLPYIRVGPGTTGVNVQFSIDPGDPEQLFIPDNGTHTFTVAFRIDHENQPSGNPCSTGAPTCCNAFPMTDNTSSSCQNYSQLSSPAGNWLFGINCGSGGCPPNGGWSTFANLSADQNFSGFCLPGCRPHGDWITRTTWSGISCSPGVGACCLPDGTCQTMTTTDCATANGTYQGDGVDCANANCPIPSGACCFGNGSCLNRTSASCTSLGGTWLGAGTACSGSACPTGACCLPSGSCAVTTAAQCTAQAGTFHGVGSSCTGANCPQPTGACCTAGGGCDQLSQSDCTTIGGTWHGAGSTCAVSCAPPTGACCTSGGAGCDLLTQADCATIGGTWLGAGTACSGCNPCIPDFNHDGTVNVADFLAFLSAYAAGSSQADVNHDAQVNVQDFLRFLQLYAVGC
jgi:hypothetical protein